MIKVGIMGVTGYAGEEVLRILLCHPEVEITYLGTNSYVGKNIQDVFPGFFDREFPVLEPQDAIGSALKCDVVFTALPHGVADETVKKLIDGGVKVIDLSADYRYDDEAVYQTWYKREHQNKDLLKEAVYGLTEVYGGKVCGQRLVANPGCYTTCSILSLLPLVKHGLIDNSSIIIDAKSGASGAGRGLKENLHFCELNESFSAYSVGTHRHTSEIEQELSKAAGEKIQLSFTPHLLPAKRGILATCYASYKGSLSQEELLDLYKQEYKDSPFVKVYPSGKWPELKHVVGSNLVGIGIVLDQRTKRVIVISCLDNLIKGAAGQAVENMNLMFGFDRTLGIPMTPWQV